MGWWAVDSTALAPVEEGQKRATRPDTGERMVYAVTDGEQNRYMAITAWV